MKLRSTTTRALLTVTWVGALAACGGGDSGDAARTGDAVSTSASGVGAGAVSTSMGDPSAGAILDGPAATTCDGVGSDTRSSPSSMLELQIGGTEAGVSYDVLDVSGRARLGGTLQVVFEEAFTPAKGQRFTLVKASCLTGVFATITANKGVVLAPKQDATHLEVTVQ